MSRIRGSEHPQVNGDTVYRVHHLASLLGPASTLLSKLFKSNFDLRVLYEIAWHFQVRCKCSSLINYACPFSVLDIDRG